MWCFMCINGERSLWVIWTDLETEFPVIFNLCTSQSLWGRHDPILRTNTGSDTPPDTGSRKKEDFQEKDHGSQNVGQKAGRH